MAGMNEWMNHNHDRKHRNKNNRNNHRNHHHTNYIHHRNHRHDNHYSSSLRWSQSWSLLLLTMGVASSDVWLATVPPIHWSLRSSFSSGSRRTKDRPGQLEDKNKGQWRGTIVLSSNRQLIELLLSKRRNQMERGRWQIGPILDRIRYRKRQRQRERKRERECVCVGVCVGLICVCRCVCVWGWVSIRTQLLSRFVSEGSAYAWTPIIYSSCHIILLVLL